MITKVGYFDIYFVLVCPEFLKTLKNIISMNKNEIVEILRTFKIYHFVFFEHLLHCQLWRKFEFTSIL